MKERFETIKEMNKDEYLRPSSVRWGGFFFATLTAFCVLMIVVAACFKSKMLVDAMVKVALGLGTTTMGILGFGQGKSAMSALLSQGKPTAPLPPSPTTPAPPPTSEKAALLASLTQGTQAVKSAQDPSSKEAKKK